LGFYVRKAFNFGPVRFNLSRSGLGASFGIKGARIGVGPRGTYIHAGRGGFYLQTDHRATEDSQHAANPAADPTARGGPSRYFQFSRADHH
jgi:hypothetical protein